LTSSSSSAPIARITVFAYVATKFYVGPVDVFDPKRLKPRLRDVAAHDVGNTVLVALPPLRAAVD
jgi:hypothetical protein